MNPSVSSPSRPLRHLSAFQPAPSGVGLAALIQLLTVVPLDANPGLCKVVSVKMNLEEILHGRGEVFEIAYDGG